MPKRHLFASNTYRSPLLLRIRRSLGATTIAACVAFGTTAVSKPAKAQEIQLTGPLAGAPSVRKARLYREGRLELAVGPGFTLLDEYQRTIFVSGRLQYNLFDWLGIGVFGGVAAANLDTDLTDKINSTAPRNSRTAINLPGQGQGSFADQTGKLKWMAAPQITFSPFRGKLALFQKLFVDTDLYIHGGAAFIGVDERGDCSPDHCTSATPGAFNTKSRVAVAPTFGLGLTFYLASFISLNIEYRALPFSWNRSGFDTRGGGPNASFPDNQINSEDRTFKFNQMVFVGAGFYLPAKTKLTD
ncbi:MAG: hypothetical protein FWD73_02990 [Polyangiaceae bacterium]|nr:hypothetical protein [Polyangiaceae bacterium]